MAGSPQQEVCDNCDNDYDGQIDEGLFCAQCSGTTFYGHQYTYSSYSDHVRSLTLGEAIGSVAPYYANNIKHTRRLHVNQRVTAVRFGLQSFESSDYDDKLSFKSVATNQTHHVLTGASVPGQYEVATGGLGDRGIDISFNTDESGQGEGFVLSGISTKCGGSLNSSYAAPLVRGMLHQGLLIEHGDVLFFSIPASTSTETFLLMDGPPGKSFKIYAKLGSIPNTTSSGGFDYAGVGDPSKNEWGIRIPPASTSGTYYIMVRTEAGGGGLFNLTYSNAKPSQRYALNVGFNASLDEIPIERRGSWIRERLVEAARRLYGATEGMAQVAEFNIYKNDTSCSCGSSCDICIHPNVDTSYCINPWGPTAWVSLYAWYIDSTGLPDYSPGTIMHEILHCSTGLIPAIGWHGDEYNEHDHWETVDGASACGVNRRTDPWCGHSVMGTTWDGNVTNLCTAHDHHTNGKHQCCIDCQIGCDYCPDLQVPPGSGSQWQRLHSEGKVMSIPPGTPDSRSLKNHAGIDSFIKVYFR